MPTFQVGDVVFVTSCYEQSKYENEGNGRITSADEKNDKYIVKMDMSGRYTVKKSRLTLVSMDALQKKAPKRQRVSPSKYIESSDSAHTSPEAIGTPPIAIPRKRKAPVKKKTDDCTPIADSHRRDKVTPSLTTDSGRVIQNKRYKMPVKPNPSKLKSSPSKLKSSPPKKVERKSPINSVFATTISLASPSSIVTKKQVTTAAKGAGRKKTVCSSPQLLTLPTVPDSDLSELTLGPNIPAWMWGAVCDTLSRSYMDCNDVLRCGVQGSFWIDHTVALPVNNSLRINRTLGSGRHVDVGNTSALLKNVLKGKTENPKKQLQTIPYTNQQHLEVECPLSLFNTFDMNAYLSKSNPQLVNDRAISVARYISASFLVSAVVDKEKVDLNNILDKARKLAVGKHGDGNSDSSDDEEEAGEECKEAQLIQWLAQYALLLMNCEHKWPRWSPNFTVHILDSVTKVSQALCNPHITAEYFLTLLRFKRIYLSWVLCWWKNYMRYTAGSKSSSKLESTSTSTATSDANALCMQCNLLTLIDAVNRLMMVPMCAIVLSHLQDSCAMAFYHYVQAVGDVVSIMVLHYTTICPDADGSMVTCGLNMRLKWGEMLVGVFERRIGHVHLSMKSSSDKSKLEGKLQETNGSATVVRQHQLIVGDDNKAIGIDMEQGTLVTTPAGADPSIMKLLVWSSQLHYLLKNPVTAATSAGGGGLIGCANSSSRSVPASTCTLPAPPALAPSSNVRTSQSLQATALQRDTFAVKLESMHGTSSTSTSSVSTTAAVIDLSLSDSDEDAEVAFAGVIAKGPPEIFIDLTVPAAAPMARSTAPQSSSKKSSGKIHSVFHGGKGKCPVVSTGAIATTGASTGDGKKGKMLTGSFGRVSSNVSSNVSSSVTKGLLDHSSSKPAVVVPTVRTPQSNPAISTPLSRLMCFLSNN